MRNGGGRLCGDVLRTILLSALQIGIAEKVIRMEFIHPATLMMSFGGRGGGDLSIVPRRGESIRGQLRRVAGVDCAACISRQPDAMPSSSGLSQI